MKNFLKILGIIVGSLAGIILLIVIATSIWWHQVGPNDYTSITQEASAKNDVSICNTIRSPFSGFGGMTQSGIIARCYQNYAEQHPQQNVCPNILTNISTTTDLVNNMDTEYQICVEGQARVSGDTSHCGMDAYCFAIAAETRGDINVCNLMDSVHYGAGAQALCRSLYGH